MALENDTDRFGIVAGYRDATGAEHQTSDQTRAA